MDHSPSRSARDAASPDVQGESGRKPRGFALYVTLPFVLIGALVTQDVLSGALNDLFGSAGMWARAAAGAALGAFGAFLCFSPRRTRSRESGRTFPPKPRGFKGYGAYLLLFASALVFVDSLSEILDALVGPSGLWGKVGAGMALAAFGGLFGRQWRKEENRGDADQPLSPEAGSRRAYGMFLCVLGGFVLASATPDFYPIGWLKDSAGLWAALAALLAIVIAFIICCIKLERKWNEHEEKWNAGTASPSPAQGKAAPLG